MTASFQYVMDYKLIGLKTLSFLDHIINISRGSTEEHLKLVYKSL